MLVPEDGDKGENGQYGEGGDIEVLVGDGVDEGQNGETGGQRKAGEEVVGGFFGGDEDVYGNEGWAGQDE